MERPFVYRGRPSKPRGDLAATSRRGLCGRARLATGRLSNLTTFEGRLVLTGILAAFTGVFVGKRLVGKITMKLVQRLTGGLLLLVGLLLGTGLL